MSEKDFVIERINWYRSMFVFCGGGTVVMFCLSVFAEMFQTPVEVAYEIGMYIVFGIGVAWSSYRLERCLKRLGALE